eukprot:456347-Amphidinium_carterae.1
MCCGTLSQVVSSDGKVVREEACSAEDRQVRTQRDCKAIRPSQHDVQMRNFGTKFSDLVGVLE